MHHSRTFHSSNSQRNYQVLSAARMSESTSKFLDRCESSAQAHRAAPCRTRYSFSIELHHLVQYFQFSGGRAWEVFSFDFSSHHLVQPCRSSLCGRFSIFHGGQHDASFRSPGMHHVPTPGYPNQLEKDGSELLH